MRPRRSTTEMTVLALTVERSFARRRCATMAAAACSPSLARPSRRTSATRSRPCWARRRRAGCRLGTLFDALPFDRLTLTDAAALLRSINARMPLPPVTSAPPSPLPPLPSRRRHLAAELDADVAADAAAGDGADTSLWASSPSSSWQRCSRTPPGKCGSMTMASPRWWAAVPLVHAAPASSTVSGTFSSRPSLLSRTNWRRRARARAHIAAVDCRQLSPRSFATTPSCGCSARSKFPRRCMIFSKVDWVNYSRHPHRRQWR